MGELKDFNTSSDQESSFFIEIQKSKIHSVQQATGFSEKEFDKLLQKVKPFCEAIVDNFQTLVPNLILHQQNLD